MLTIKITVKGGKAIRIQKSEEEAQGFVDTVLAHGFLDPASASYCPAASILSVEVEPLRSHREKTVGKR